MLIYYKDPLSPIPNDSLKEMIQNKKDDENDEQANYQLLSSIDFNILTKSNEEIDLASSKQIFHNLLSLLDSGMLLTDFPEFIIPRIIDLSFFYSNDQDIINFSVNIIFFLSFLDEYTCFQYIDENIINLLIEIIKEPINLGNVQTSIFCLNDFITNKSLKDNSEVDGMLILQETVEFLQNFNQNFDLNDQLKHKELISLAFKLIANCLIAYDLTEDIIESIIQKMINFIQPINQKEKEIENKVNRIWQISAMQAISIIIFEKSKSDESIDEFYLNYFINNDDILNLLIDLIKSDFEYELDNLSIFVFCILENLSYRNLDFSLNFIKHESSLLFFQPPEQWGIKPKSNYCRSIITSVGRLCECREHNYGEESLQLAIETLVEAAPNLVNLMMNYVETEAFKLRKVASIVLCQLITLNNSSILHVLMQAHEKIIEDFIFLLDDNVKEPLAYSLIKSMIILCKFGDKISFESLKPNPFLDIILDLNIEDILENYTQIYHDSERMTKIINNLIDEIENCKRNQEIDFDQEEEIIEIYI